MSKLVDGNKISERIIKKLQERIKKNKLSLKVSVVLVGDNKVSLSYIRQKGKMAEKIGIDFTVYNFLKKIKEDELIKKIKKIEEKSSGLIIQLPLPSYLNKRNVLNSISEKKDIDFLSKQNLSYFYNGDFSFLPPVISAINYILKDKKISVKGKNIVLIGYGDLVGKPLSFWLASSGATISVLNEYTKKLKDFTLNADILISGVGKKDLIKPDMVKKNVIVIDAGSSYFNGKIVGDINRLVFKKSLIHCPVPGGIGPITTASLFENLIKFKELN
jgi:methylenetetrahydrofolate dehydrogenase (NADP+) / methenyltetrahydrofolate cyclohydrolase